MYCRAVIGGHVGFLFESSILSLECGTDARELGALLCSLLRL